MNILRKINIVFNDIICSLIIILSVSLGRKLRYLYWKKRLKRCGKNVIIDEGVIIQNPEWISIGDNVWIDRYCVLIAGEVNLNNSIVKYRENRNFTYKKGELVIEGNNHISAFNIIQAHGGVIIGKNAAVSAGGKIYSLSNYPYDDENKNEITFTNSLARDRKRVPYILSPVVIGENVWLGLNVIVLGGTIGKNSFIASNSLVLYDIEENSYAEGKPAKKIKERFQTKEDR